MGQNLDGQIAALRAAGVEMIYREKASGKSVGGRPQPEKAIMPWAPATCWWSPNGTGQPVP